MSTTFFHTRQSSELLPEHAPSSLVLKPPRRRPSTPLAERSSSQMNKEANSNQPTIRLVDTDSSSPSVYDKTPFPSLPSHVLKPPRTTKHGYTIQDDNLSSCSPRSSPKIKEKSPERKRLIPQPLNLKPNPNRISSSTTISNADTLLNDPLFSPVSWTHSQDGTVRNTPTPFEMEERGRDRKRESARSEGLGILSEESQDSAPTIRPVTASTRSGSHSRASDTPRNSALIHADGRNGVSAQHARLESIMSVGTQASAGVVRSPTLEDPSSDYSSSPPNSRNADRSSSYNIIRYASSTDNMSVQYPEIRPPTAQSQSATSAFSASEEETVPPIVPQRRRLHMHSASAGAVRQSNLSTILSEPEQSSRENTRSRFSHGSAFDLLRSGTPQPGTDGWPRRRRTIGSVSAHSHSSGSNYGTASENSLRSDDGVERTDSAVPPALFSSSSRPLYELDGNTPSRETEEEQDDTIAELQAPPLRQQRSGYLARHRSMGEMRPGTAKSSNTLGEADRTSQGSNIFPLWAKSFYRGQSQLNSANASKVSLAHGHSQVRMMPWAHHQRFLSSTSAWQSITSSPGTIRSILSSSPAGSSHFLPSIFRPYSRRPGYNDSARDNSPRSSMDYYDHNGQEADSEVDFGSRTDSMAITEAPPLRHHTVRQVTPPQHAHIARQKRQKGKQRQRQHSHHLPRDPTFSSSHYTSRSIYDMPPHLAPSRRLSHRISAWRAPSFDEALNTLVVTRQNRQILFFCLGFLCPLLWMVAAFLPLPQRPMDARLAEYNTEISVMDLNTEKDRYTLGMQMEMMDWEKEKRWLKARWWRNLNRVMSVVGVGVIAAIIALAVIASR